LLDYTCITHETFKFEISVVRLFLFVRHVGIHWNNSVFCSRSGPHYVGILVISATKIVISVYPADSRFGT
jgi:hypothetical protein